MTSSARASTNARPQAAVQHGLSDNPPTHSFSHSLRCTRSFSTLATSNIPPLRLTTMASLPPQRPASQRRPSPPAEASSSSHQEETTRSSSFSAASVDSQTLLLNSPQAQAADNKQSDAPQQSTAPQLQEDDEPRKCWICFNDETEDDDTTSGWRSPCTCSLVAHEKCLLDWIADMEGMFNEACREMLADEV